MPVTILNKVSTSTAVKTFDVVTLPMLAKLARQKLDLPDDAVVKVGMNIITVHMNGVEIVFPVKPGQLAKPDAYWEKVRETMSMLATPMAVPMHYEDDAVGPPPEDGSENWATAVASKYLSPVVALHKATQMHERVHGTSSHSVYRVAFLGPNLRGAVRIKPNALSIRFTTADNTAPTGKVATILKRLGLEATGLDRYTGHCNLSSSHDVVPYEYHALLGAFYAGLRPYLHSPYPDLTALASEIK